MNNVFLIPLEGIPIIKSGDNIAEIIISACKKMSFSIKNQDVVVIAQKIVSKAENAVVNLKTIIPSDEANRIAKETKRDPRLIQVYLNESLKVLFIKNNMVITKHRLGFKMSSSGVDRSNIAPRDEDLVVLLPRDSDASANEMRKEIFSLINKSVAVIINDSCGRDDRDGSVGMAIGIAGISHIEFRQQKDLFGNNCNSRIALVDELAAAASILMGQGNEGIPIVIIRGVNYSEDSNASIRNILN